MKKLLFLIITFSSYKGLSQSYDQLKSNLKVFTPSTGLVLADGNDVVYDNTYSNEVDNNDVIKNDNFGENFAVLRNGFVLAVEAREVITSTDTVFFKIWNLQILQYQLEFVPNNFNVPGLTAVLEDKFLGTLKPLSLTDTTRINFDVTNTSGTGSSAPDRFRVLFKITTLPVIFTNIKANKINENNVMVEWEVATEQGIKYYDIEHSTDGRKFTKAGYLSANRSVAGIASYNWVDEHAVTGANYYRIKGVGLAGDATYTKIAKVSIGNVHSDFTISPNPVTDGKVMLQFINQPEGMYYVRIINTTGREMLVRSIDYKVGGYSIYLGTLDSGVYYVEIVSPDKQRFVKRLVNG